METIATHPPRRPHGRRIRCRGGHHAWLPAPLPPPIAWGLELVAALSAADRAVGRLACEGRRQQDPERLARPFMRREAVLSSRIEGTRATLGELLVAEATGAVESSPEDLREVASYVVALEHGLSRLTALPLSLRLVRELHEKLMGGLRREGATPGEFRRTQNWIGRPGCGLNEASYVPPPPEHLMESIRAWELFLHDERHDARLPPLVHGALAHSQFEAIHPFVNGNGRVGRLLITLHLVARRVLPWPLLDLSAWFEATRREYYARLLGVTERGEWEEWLCYFLTGVATQAEDGLARIQRIEALMGQWREELGASPSRLPQRALELLVQNPFWTITGLAGRLEVAFTSAQRAVDRLQGAGIVTLVGEARRNRVYCARALLAILEKPARLGGGVAAAAAGGGA